MELTPLWMWDETEQPWQEALEQAHDELPPLGGTSINDFVRQYVLCWGSWDAEGWEALMASYGHRPRTPLPPVTSSDSHLAVMLDG